MSNGGAESTPGRSKADDFGYAVARKAVAQVCEKVGFEGLKESALDALTDVTLRYLRDLGKTASSNANICGRTQCSIFDVVRGFEDIGSYQGFPGAYNSGSCLVSSGTIRNIIDFVESEEEIPFAQPVPQFPIVRESKLIPSFEKMNETPPGNHIPAWLPALPDQHTYMHTPMWDERVSDPRAEKIEQARQRRKAERALLSLQQRLAIPVPNNMEKHVSVMEPFAPAIEAAKEVGVNEDGDGDGEGGRTLLPEKRHTVKFRFKTRERMLVEPLDVHLTKKVEWRSEQSLGREDERDDKKRRAEYIYRQSMEYPPELTQL
ncbi:unnamed protein product [Linum tenue]|uniref:Transcription initiation factor TFIID subunit 8 n=1 Tax=Linum tenue TaxID=586396 RepID=A0AAV0L0M5_9ROSI|nr:unnamed protein product [Linum tenue]